LVFKQINVSIHKNRIGLYFLKHYY